MEKNWIVEVWGNIPFVTEVYYTKREAEAYFKEIRGQLDSSSYIMTTDSIVDKNNFENAAYLTNLSQLG